jgi:hypothetical protein
MTETHDTQFHTICGRETDTQPYFDGIYAPYVDLRLSEYRQRDIPRFHA